ncbi:putative Tumor protein d52 [Trichostrongylus colubriformis]|uniref:Tumor protein d52 n=1 Tax=Trichostrongylus colubriformis TaxID=6319 RepID=A0AAN8F1U8_TRICO
MATPAMESADPVFDTYEDHTQLSDAEAAILKDELRKTEEEIQTLKQVLLARQKHASELKRKLGLNPLVELGNDINKGLKAVTDTEAFQKTSEVAAATADTVKHKWNDVRNSSLFKSFESKLGTAYTSAKMAASTSIDHLAGAARGGGSHAATPAEENKPVIS